MKCRTFRKYSHTSEKKCGLDQSLDVLKPFYIAFPFLRTCSGCHLIDFCIMPVCNEEEARKIEAEHQFSIRCDQTDVDIIVDQFSVFVGSFNKLLSQMHFKQTERK